MAISLAKPLFQTYYYQKCPQRKSLNFNGIIYITHFEIFLNELWCQNPGVWRFSGVKTHLVTALQVPSLIGFYVRIQQTSCSLIIMVPFVL